MACADGNAHDAAAFDAPAVLAGLVAISGNEYARNPHRSDPPPRPSLDLAPRRAPRAQAALLRRDRGGRRARLVARGRADLRPALAPALSGALERRAASCGAISQAGRRPPGRAPKALEIDLPGKLDLSRRAGSR